jgi:hypothetical protein
MFNTIIQKTWSHITSTPYISISQNMGDQHLWSKCHNRKSKVVNANLSNYPLPKVDWIIVQDFIFVKSLQNKQG